MSNINLLPENLRDRERASQAGADSPSSPPPRYSIPGNSSGGVPANSRSAEPSASVWQRIAGMVKSSAAPATSALPPSGEASADGRGTKIDLIHTIPTSTPAPEPVVVAAPAPAPITPPVSLPKVAQTPVVPPLPPVLPRPATRQVATPLPRREPPVEPAQPRRMNISAVPPAGERADKDTSSANSPELGVNLIPTDVRVEQPRRVVKELVWTAMLSAVLVGLVYVGLLAYRDSRVSQNDAAQKAIIVLQQQVESSAQVIETAGTISKRMVAVNRLLKSRPSLLPLFEFLEHTTLPTISYTNLVADENGQVTLAGQAPTLTDMARQMKVFTESPQIDKFTLGGFQYGGGKEAPAPVPVKGEKVVPEKTNILFTFILSIKPSLFQPAGK